VRTVFAPGGYNLSVDGSTGVQIYIAFIRNIAVNASNIFVYKPRTYI